MNRDLWLRGIESTALIFGYIWYNANIHIAIARLLS